MKIIKTITISLSFLLILNLYFACSGSEENTEKQKDTKPYLKVIEHFYSAYINQDYHGMVDVCHNLWLKYWDLEKTVAYFKEVEGVEGKVDSYKVVSIDQGKDFAQTGLDGSQIQVITEADRFYAITEEVFILYKDPEATKYEILQYSVRELKSKYDEEEYEYEDTDSVLNDTI